ncbi:MAG: MFS transporter [Desulfurococcales archaeon]|nr:MFS transporter [Desulfurococcales archaeon]
MNRSVYAVLLVAVFIAGMGSGLSRLALAKMLRDDLGASMLVVSSLTTWFMAARALSSTVSGLGASISHRVWKALLLLPLPLVSLIVYLLGSMRDPATILALNAAWGFVNGLLWPQAQAAAGTLLKGRGGLGIALYFAIGSLGISMGHYLYGILGLSNPETIRASSTLFLAASPAMALVAFKAEKPGATYRRGQSLAGISSASLWIIIAAYASGYSSGVLREFLYVYLGEVYGLAREELGSVLALAGIVSLILGLLVGPAADRWGTHRVLAAVLLMGSIGNAFIGMAPGVTLALVGISLAQASSRSSMPLTRNIGAFDGPQALALLGISNTVSSIGQMSGPVIAGTLYDRLGGSIVLGLPGEAYPFLVALLLLLLALALYPLMVRR